MGGRAPAERLFISEFIGPGFHGIQHAPFMIPDAGAGLATLSAAAGMTMEWLDRRQSLRRALVAAGPGELAGSVKAADDSRTIDDARAMMDSPVKRAFAYGRTAERDPMVPVEKPVYLTDVHATIYEAMGIAPDTSCVTERRPFYVTQDGKGKGRGVGELTA